MSRRRRVTFRQRDYILILVKGPVEERVVSDFLENYERQSVADLTLVEGSALIDILKYYAPTLYTSGRR